MLNSPLSSHQIETGEVVNHVDDLVINWHLTEACNFSCQYCFAKYSHKHIHGELWQNAADTYTFLKNLYEFFKPENEANPLRKTLKWENVRLTLAGGEPTLLKHRVVEIAEDAKDIGFKLSLISNGSKPAVINKMSRLLDSLTISLDSTRISTSLELGRCDRKKRQVYGYDLAELFFDEKCSNPKLKRKLNTVVNAINHREDFNDLISFLQLDRWKILRVLGNVSKSLLVNQAEFDAFVKRHEKFDHIMSVEDNDDMMQSYIMVDPHGRFYQNDLITNGYTYSAPILNAGVKNAFNQINFSAHSFANRYPSKNHGG